MQLADLGVCSSFCNGSGKAVEVTKTTALAAKGAFSQVLVREEWASPRNGFKKPQTP